MITSLLSRGQAASVSLTRRHGLSLDVQCLPVDRRRCAAEARQFFILLLLLVLAFVFAAFFTVLHFLLVIFTALYFMKHFQEWRLLNWRAPPSGTAGGRLPEMAAFERFLRYAKMLGKVFLLFS